VRGNARFQFDVAQCRRCYSVERFYMLTIADKLTDVGQRITETERRIAELRTAEGLPKKAASSSSG
jgi:hypothetical protein